MESCFRRQEYGVKSQATKTIRKEKSLLHKIKWNRVILDEVCKPTCTCILLSFFFFVIGS